MKYLLLSLFLLLSTSFIKQNNEPRILLGTMQLFVNNNGEYYIEYQGKYEVCFMQKMSQILFDCDSTMLTPYFEDVQKKYFIIDSSYYNKPFILPIDTIKTFKI